MKILVAVKQVASLDEDFEIRPDGKDVNPDFLVRDLNEWDDFSLEVAMKIKEVLTLDRPFVKKSAWIGSEHIPHALMENFHFFSQRETVTFKTREEALDWLVEE